MLPMWQRLVFAVVTLFFITMNVLLFRAEIIGEQPVGSPVPLDLVWRKMLSAPDVSSLQIREQGVPVGMVRWLPSLYEAPPRAGAPASRRRPEGMVGRVAGYSIEMDGYYLLEGDQRLRFNLSLDINTNHVWRQAILRLGLDTYRWEIVAEAQTRTVRLRVRDEQGTHERTFRFEDLARPQDLGWPTAGPAWTSLLLGLGLPQAPQSLASRPWLHWQARRAWLDVGPVRVRGYRLKARLFDRYPVTVFINTVGEIVRVELPRHILLINDNLTKFEAPSGHD